MTNEIEKQFFDTFGIEPKILNGCKFERCLNINKSVFNCIKEKCPHYYKDKVFYPQITNRILLELICILNKNELWGLPNDTKFLKQQILQSCTMFVEHGRDCTSVKEKEVKEFIHQVRTLFKEG